MNGEGYRDPTADIAIGKADREEKASRRFPEGYVPPDAWHFTKPYLQAMSAIGYSTIIIIEDENGFKHRIRCRR